MTHNLSLPARVELLESQIRALTAVLTGPRAITVRPYGLTPQQMLLCVCLARAGFASIETLEGLLPAALRSRRAGADNPTMLLRSQISKIRQHLKPAGVEIVNLRSEGYRVTAGLPALRSIVNPPTKDPTP